MPETTSQLGPVRSADAVRRRLGVSKGDTNTPTPVDPAEVQDFDWTTPCLYTLTERGRLENFASRTLPGVRAALIKALRAELPLTPQGPATLYFHQACGEGSYYALPLRLESAVAGVLRIDAAFAGGCVERLLGGSGELRGQGRELSPLENSLLQDLCATLAEAFVQVYRDVGGPALAAAGELVTNRLPLSLPSEHEVVQFALVQTGQAKPPLAFVFPHERVDFIAQGLSAPAVMPSSDECRARLLAALNDADLAGEIWLRSAATTMNDVLALEPDDVLLLPQGINEPVELTIQGRKLFEGLLGTQHGQYALEILSVH